MNEKIRVAQGKKIRLTFTYFEVHACKACHCDFLKISDGEKLLLRKDKGCGSHMAEKTSENYFELPTITSESNEITIYFQTDAIDQEDSSGWNIAWEAVDPGERSYPLGFHFQFSIRSDDHYHHHFYYNIGQWGWIRSGLGFLFH